MFFIEIVSQLEMSHGLWVMGTTLACAREGSVVIVQTRAWFGLAEGKNYNFEKSM